MAHRRDIFEFSEQDRLDLVNKILDFLGQNQHLLEEHMAIVGSESDPDGQNFGDILYRGLVSDDLHENIWHGHRYYISKLEDYLLQNGGERFVPLPKWDAHTKIPEQFKRIFQPHSVPFPPINYDLYNSWSDTGGPTVAIDGFSFTIGGKLITVPGVNVTPRRPQIPEKVRNKIHEIASSMDLAKVLNDYHFEVHEKLGGIMVDPHHTAAATLFWIWHAALEDFYHKWMRTKLIGARNLRLVKNDDDRLEAFVIGDDRKVWHSFQWWRYGGWSYWKSLGGNKVHQIEVGRNKDGRLEVFATNEDRSSLIHAWQNSAGASWSDWHELSGPPLPNLAWPITQIAVLNSTDGRLNLFVLVRRPGVGSDLMHCQQIAPNGNWGQWINVGQSIGLREIAVGWHPTGVLEVFAIDTQGAPRSIYQTQRPSRGWSGWVRQMQANWKRFKGLSVAAGGNGRLFLFAIERTTSEVFYREAPLRTPPLRPPNPSLPEVWFQPGWTPLNSGSVNTIAVGTHSDGRLDVFAIDLNRKLIHIAQTTLDPGSWGQWQAVGQDTNHLLDEISVARNDRDAPPSFEHGRLVPGTLEVIGKFREETIWHKWEKSPSGPDWVRWQLF